MGVETKLTVKIISYPQNTFLGWKGTVLEVGLMDGASLLEFLAGALGVAHHAIVITHKEGFLYEVVLNTKHAEDMVILTT